MQRRNFVKAVSGLGILGITAGCLTDDNTDEPQNTTNVPVDTETSTDTVVATDTQTSTRVGEDTQSDTYTDSHTQSETFSGTESDTATEQKSITDSPTPVPPTEFTLDNVGRSAWEVTSGSQAVSATGENPTLNLEAGQRYVVQNNGGSVHPLGFRDSTGTVLLSQSETGEFENREDVSWVDNGDTVEFTLTPELAERLDEYYCTVHASMFGSIRSS